ncbi:hypothetical protein [Bacillus phage vB_BceS-M2]
MAMCRDKNVMKHEINMIDIKIAGMAEDIEKYPLTDSTLDVLEVEMKRLEKSLEEHINYCKWRFTEEEQRYITSGITLKQVETN